MALICTKFQEWLEEVTEDIEVWEERQEKRCKEYPWWDPRGWFCWLFVWFVKVIRTIVITAAQWVTRTICVWLTTLWEMLVNILEGLWNFFAGLLTLDFNRMFDGLSQLGLGTMLGLIKLFRVFFLGDTIDFIVGKFQRSALRDHVRDRLEALYSGETLQQIKDAIGVDHGSFGLTIHCTALRCVLDSETPSPTDPTAPNLVVLHEQGEIKLRDLCGFESSEGYFNRKRYKTLKKETGLAGGGGGEFENPISEDELNTYLASRGSQGPAFTILSMKDAVLRDKLDAAEDKGNQLGLKIAWSERLIPISQVEHVVQSGGRPDQVTFLISPVGRTDKSANMTGARAELCRPVAVGVFRYAARGDGKGRRGLASPLDNTACGLPGQNVSGVTFIDNIPDLIWKYVPIHELGHYFGLCHVDGIDRIMLSNNEKSAWSWSVIPNLYLKGEPHFTHGEAKAVWTHIIANFPPVCLGASA